MDKEVTPAEDLTPVVDYLSQLIESYEDLVRDMSATLNKNHEEFKLLEAQVSTQPVVCEDCKTSSSIIDNLRNQIDNLNKSKILTTALWHSSVEQIEQLENRLKLKAEAPSTQLKTTSDTQIKLLQTYVARLEERLEQSSQEKNFYRRKLMETKLENELNLKNAAIEKKKDIELVKSSYSTEIQHLKQTLEKERQMYQSSLEKKMEEERKNWIREEQERKDHLKTKWLTQIQPLLVEQEALLARESQLCEKLHQTQSELFQLKQVLSFPQIHFPHNTNLPEQIRPNVIRNVPNDVPLKNTDNVPVLKRCDHDECVKYNMHQKVLDENERLGEEIARIRKSNQSLEAEYIQNSHRLELRISDLENLNSKLQSKLIEISPKNNQFDNNIGHKTHSSHLKESTKAGKDKKRNSVEDPILSLADDFSRLCNLSFEEKFADPVKRLETEARVEHLERYARELQFRHHLDKQKWYLREKSLKSQFNVGDEIVK